MMRVTKQIVTEQITSSWQLGVRSTTYQDILSTVSYQAIEHLKLSSFKIPELRLPASIRREFTDCDLTDDDVPFLPACFDEFGRTNIQTL